MLCLCSRELYCTVIFFIEFKLFWLSVTKASAVLPTPSFAAAGRCRVTLCSSVGREPVIRAHRRSGVDRSGEERSQVAQRECRAVPSSSRKLPLTRDVDLPMFRRHYCSSPPRNRWVFIPVLTGGYCDEWP